MGFKKIGIGVGLLMLFMMPAVLALNTPIQIRTQPNYAVTIRALDVDGTGTLENGAFLDQIADANGIVKINFSSEIVNKIDISLMVKTAVGGTMIQFAGGPVQVLNNNKEHIKTGWPVEIDATANPPVLVKSGKPEGVIEEETTNKSDSDNSFDVSLTVDENKEPEQEVQETNNEISAETNTGVTGKSIGIGKSIFTSKITYFIFGFLVLVLIFGFIFKNKILNSHQQPEPKRSEFKVLARENPKLRDAERKLDQAKKELDEIRNKNFSLQEARKRLEADRRELERLEKG
jgi:hypothetical protein